MGKARQGKIKTPRKARYMVSGAHLELDSHAAQRGSCKPPPPCPVYAAPHGPVDATGSPHPRDTDATQGCSAAPPRKWGLAALEASLTGAKRCAQQTDAQQHATHRIERCRTVVITPLAIHCILVVVEAATRARLVAKRAEGAAGGRLATREVGGKAARIAATDAR